MLSQLIKNSLEQSVRQVFTALGAAVTELPSVVLEQPANPDFGDYSSNIAMQLAKVLHKAPMAIAELITTEISQSGGLNGLFRKIDIAAPGFINLYIDWQEWAGRSFELPGAAGEKVIIEHTSVNPNKSMHIGHLRNSCIGDALVRILRKTGYSVEVHNYVDDLGNQLADTVVGLLNVPLAGDHVRFGDYCWDIYAGVNKEYALHPESVHKRTDILHALEEGHGNTAWLGSLVAERIVREHVAEMKGFGIGYDLLVWESSILKEGFWASAFALLKQTEVFVQETEGKLAGCWILKQAAEEPSGADADEHHKDKVLVRSNGILTYTAKDIAYHLWKFGLLDKDFSYSEFNAGLWTTGLSGERLAFGSADRVVNVIDYRQEYPQAMVKQALEVLGYTEQAGKLHHVSYGVVSLSPASAAELGIDISEGKASYAMSGRQGIGIKVTELVQLMENTIDATRSDKSGLPSRLIATAAIRYYLLRFNLGTEIIFDFKQATEISGNTGVYLMYTYARAGSVLSKAGAPAAEAELNAEMTYPSAEKANLNAEMTSSSAEIANLNAEMTSSSAEIANPSAEQTDALPVFPAILQKAELALLRHLSNWQDTLYSASVQLTPNTICNYAHTLASLFNNFYSACPILKGEIESVAFRLWLTLRFRDTLGEVLEVLGLPQPERM
ncbi:MULTISPECIES: arginine--tRNA ligase [unclassified Paenibacillus]|uniref:arginine--tRNA ligase n=1 Tax=unclassified Paenibacillus TaxID=185978 RepID=UPI0024051FD9|nr:MULTISPECIES: arginine--tRNA ligase [unclassified Paenibacillus]MDF9844088.1 arginyl-tRNA synthetase [Paenibacillus sp. PastF-2]MDF9850790.1 arginyl-tRNA synthetase [Paenibacillus sp. PastM-2]MDF9857360.1 arginyl-tRNA synthetase [Paenibacillus sp. PastF-1]MDH6482532.1 arginyl-tRNA synthetase [Paenibacillus sp. PastH-2]MDH6509960.1 arginyl-tRNA synthetase [Paenibacillus sp. PastM-3]